MKATRFILALFLFCTKAWAVNPPTGITVDARVGNTAVLRWTNIAQVEQFQILLNGTVTYQPLLAATTCCDGSGKRYFTLTSLPYLASTSITMKAYQAGVLSIESTAVLLGGAQQQDLEDLHKTPVSAVNPVPVYVADNPNTRTITPTPTITPTITATPTLTATLTITQTYTLTYTLTPTPTATNGMAHGAVAQTPGGTPGIWQRVLQLPGSGSDLGCGKFTFAGTSYTIEFAIVPTLTTTVGPTDSTLVTQADPRRFNWRAADAPWLWVRATLNTDLFTVVYDCPIPGLGWFCRLDLPDPESVTLALYKANPLNQGVL